MCVQSEFQCNCSTNPPIACYCVVSTSYASVFFASSANNQSCLTHSLAGYSQLVSFRVRAQNFILLSCRTEAVEQHSMIRAFLAFSAALGALASSSPSSSAPGTCSSGACSGPVSHTRNGPSGKAKEMGPLDTTDVYARVHCRGL